MKVSIEDPGSLGARPLLLLVRHVSTADTILASIFVAERYGIVLRYVLKRELLWDPCLDIVGNRLVNVFVRRGGGDSQADLAAVASLTENLGPGEGILIYPEGTRFTTEKRRRIIEKLSQRGDEIAARRARDLTRVLPPRLGGTLALLEQASKWDIGICAHVGMDKATSFADFLSGALVGAEVRIRIGLHRGETLPKEREPLTEWIYDRWAEVDRFVAARGT
jgi:1-acyl-sn-glycerol-3-phosphate acyltransferase